MPKTGRVAQHDLASVAIVTPSYNQAPFIEKAIESVLAQEYPNLDYLVVDAGSTDGTLDILRSFGDRVRWISEPDTGQGEGVDKGIRLTQGEIIGWLNADDLYAPGAVSSAVDALGGSQSAPGVYGNATFIDADGREIGPCTHVEPFSLTRLINYLDFIVQPATFFRRSAYQSAGGLDWGLRYCLDYDLMIRLGRQAPLLYLPRVQAFVRVYPSTKTASGGLPRLDEIERMIRRHGRGSLPRFFQREMVTVAWQELKLGVSSRRWGRAGRGAMELARYGPRVTARRVARAVRR
ncbi:MAG: glycosyltransferase family 2 protein [Candidatus Limnocylindrales bacterium]